MATPRKTTTASAETPDETTSFSFDAWLGNGTRPARYVTLYSANDLQAEIDAINREINDAEAAAGNTMAGASGIGHLEKRRDELQKQLEASGVVFKVRAIGQDKSDDIARRRPIPDDATDEQRGQIVLARWVEQVAAQVVAVGPTRDDMQDMTLTVDQVTALRDRIGEVEYEKLLNSCLECMSEVSASRPFWRGSSGPARTSSTN